MFIVAVLIVLVALISIFVFKDYTNYKKTYENICNEGITVELPSGALGKVVGVTLPPNNVNVKVKVPCAPIG